MTEALDREDLLRWVWTAVRGEAVVYYTGEHLQGPGREIGAAAREASENDLVFLVQRRTDARLDPGLRREQPLLEFTAIRR